MFLDPKMQQSRLSNLLPENSISYPDGFPETLDPDKTAPFRRTSKFTRPRTPLSGIATRGARGSIMRLLGREIEQLSVQFSGTPSAVSDTEAKNSRNLAAGLFDVRPGGKGESRGGKTVKTGKTPEPKTRRHVSPVKRGAETPGAAQVTVCGPRSMEKGSARIIVRARTSASPPRIERNEATQDAGQQ